MMNASEVLAIACAALGGAVLHHAFVARKKCLPHCLIVYYRVPDGGEISVRACACSRCKNVVWAQRAEIEPPKFCAYCGLKYDSIEIAADGDMEARGMIVTD